MHGKIVVSQLGARMHYAVPRILESEGLLAHFYTDICATQSWPRLLSCVPPGILPTAIRRLVGRVPHGLPAEHTTTFPGYGLHSAIRRLACRTRSDETAIALWAGHRFGELVASRGFHDASGLYSFSGEALVQMRAARAQGLWTAVEQMIAPRSVVDRLVAEEEAAFPHWQAPVAHDAFAAAYAAREREEWLLADVVICPSTFVQRLVIDQGCPASRIAVVPYGVDRRPERKRKGRLPGPLRVLSVGEVCLRKGSPYVLAAAELMKGEAIFRMVGPCTVLPEARAALEAAVELVRPVPRAEMHKHYDWADVFLLPSICEGSATAVYEALAAGLPVICTDNTGSVVRHQREGFIVPIRDTDAIVQALRHLASDAWLRLSMGRSAFERASEFTLERYSERLVAALSAVLRDGERASCAA